MKMMIWMLGTLCCFMHVTAYASNWRHFNSGQNDYNINDLACHGEVVWCATDTGVFSYHKRKKKCSPKYQISDDLSDNVFGCVYVARTGMVWALSMSGASCYDGESWTCFTADVYFDGVPPVSVAEDGNGTIWFVSAIGVTTFDGEHWSTHDAPQLTVASSIAVAPDNTVWIGTDRRGLFRFDGTVWKRIEPLITVTTFDRVGQETGEEIVDLQTLSIGRLRFADDVLYFKAGDAFYAKQPGGWTKTAIYNHEKCTAVLYDGREVVFQGYTDNGLNVINLLKHGLHIRKAMYVEDRFKQSVLSMCRDENGDVWLGYDRKLCWYVDGEIEVCLECKEILDEYVRFVEVDGNDCVWCMTMNHEYVAIGDGFRRTDMFRDFDGDGYDKGTVRFGPDDSIYYLQEPNLYKCNTDGLFYKVYSPMSNTYNGSVRDLGFLDDGALLFSCRRTMSQYGSGYGVLSDDVLFLDLSADQFDAAWSDIVVGQDGLCWMYGCPRNYKTFGVYSFRFDPTCSPPVYGFELVDDLGCEENPDVIHYGFQKDDTMVADHDGVLWLAVMRGTDTFLGVRRIDGFSTSWYDSTNSALPGNLINCIAVDRTNAKWFATDHGLARFKSGEWIVFTVENSGLIDDNVTSVAFTSDNTAWIGTASGMCVLSGDRIVAVNEEHSREELPHTVAINGVYPNPFNPCTTIRYTLNESAHVNLSVYSVTGQKVVTLVDMFSDAGMYKRIFDGAGLASGVYLYRLRANDTVLCGKMVLTR